MLSASLPLATPKQRASLALLATLFACHAPESAPHERSAPRSGSSAQHTSSTSSAAAHSSSPAQAAQPPAQPRRKTKRLYWAGESLPQQPKTTVVELCAELDDGELLCAFDAEHGGCATRHLPLGVQQIGRSRCAISSSGGAVSLSGAGCQWSSGKLSERPLASEREICDFDPKGTVYCTEGQAPRRQVLSRVEQLEAGGTFLCALRKGGEVWCWGSNAEGGLGDGRSHESKRPVRVRLAKPALSLAVGWKHACVVLTGGDVSCWAENTQGAVGVGKLPSAGDIPIPDSPNEYLLPQRVVGLSSATSVLASGNQTCALTRAGEVYCWGEIWIGRPGEKASVPSPTRVSGLPPAVTLAIGIPTCAVTAVGEVYCWGDGCPLTEPQAAPHLVEWTARRISE